MALNLVYKKVNMVNYFRREFIDRGEWCLKVEKIMKKLFSLFMIIALSLTLSACSSEPEVEEEKEEVYETFVRGEWVDNVYTNDFLGFSFTLPENWTLASDEELLSMLETATDEMLSEEMKEQYDKAIESAQSFYEFAVFNLTTGESMLLNIEDLSKTVGAILLSEDQFIDALETNFGSVEGVKFEILNREDVSLSMGKFRVLNINVNDVMTQKYYVMKDGKYMISFIVGYLNQAHDGVDSILEQIQ